MHFTIVAVVVLFAVNMFCICIFIMCKRFLCGFFFIMSLFPYSTVWKGTQFRRMFYILGVFVAPKWEVGWYMIIFMSQRGKFILIWCSIQIPTRSSKDENKGGTQPDVHNRVNCEYNFVVFLLLELCLHFPTQGIINVSHSVEILCWFAKLFSNVNFLNLFALPLCLSDDYMQLWVPL